jgi:hypothetical protein
MQPYPEGGRAAAHHPRRRGRLEALPRDQQNRLALALRQLTERVPQLPRQSSQRIGIGRLLGHGWSQTLDQRRAAMPRPSLVGQHPAGHAEQPWQRLRRDVRRPPPGDQERLGEDVIAVGVVDDSARDVGLDRGEMLREQPLE